jgi:ubiquinone biosynthesis protein UbiJ
LSDQLVNMLPTSLIPAAINHLLAQESWARSNLVAHTGKVAVFDAGLIVVRLKVAGDGSVETAASDMLANVTIRAKFSELPLIAQNRERAFSYVKIEGDADFANTISQLSQSLRWEAEEDLSKWIGDIAAVRVVSGTKAIVGTIQSTQRKVAENLAEYFLEENPMLTRPQDVADFTRDVAKLRDDVERLTKRIDKLNGSTK